LDGECERSGTRACAGRTDNIHPPAGYSSHPLHRTPDQFRNVADGRGPRRHGPDLCDSPIEAPGVCPTLPTEFFRYFQPPNGLIWLLILGGRAVPAAGKGESNSVGTGAPAISESDSRVINRAPITAFSIFVSYSSPLE
jgi:hypothetical protein